MKTFLAYTAVFLALLSASCSKKTFVFHTHYDLDFKIPAVTTSVPPVNAVVPISLESEITNNDSRVDLIEKATLESFYIDLTEPKNRTFSWCEEIHMYLIAEGVPETEIAYALHIDPLATHIDLTPTGANLAAYLKQKTYKVKVTVMVREVFNEEMRVTGRMNFRIESRFR
jgi:hypothetical protein